METVIVEEVERNVHVNASFYSPSKLTRQQYNRMQRIPYVPRRFEFRNEVIDVRVQRAWVEQEGSAAVAYHYKVFDKHKIGYHLVLNIKSKHITWELCAIYY